MPVIPLETLAIHKLVNCGIRCLFEFDGHPAFEIVEFFVTSNQRVQVTVTC